MQATSHILSYTDCLEILQDFFSHIQLYLSNNAIVKMNDMVRFLIQK